MKIYNYIWHFGRDSNEGGILSSNFFVVVHVITNCLTLWLATIITMDKLGYLRWKYVFLWFIGIFKHLFQKVKLKVNSTLKMMFYVVSYGFHSWGKVLWQELIGVSPALSLSEKKFWKVSESWRNMNYLFMAFELWVEGTTVTFSSCFVEVFGTTVPSASFLTMLLTGSSHKCWWGGTVWKRIKRKFLLSVVNCPESKANCRISCKWGNTMIEMHKNISKTWDKDFPR